MKLITSIRPFLFSSKQYHVATVLFFFLFSGVATLRAFPRCRRDGRAILYDILYDSAVRFGRFHENGRHGRRKAPGSVGADRRKALPRSSVRRVSHGRVNRRAPGNVRDGATTGRKDDAEARTNKGRDPAGNPTRTDGRTDERTCSRPPLGLG